MEFILIPVETVACHSLSKLFFYTVMAFLCFYLVYFYLRLFFLKNKFRKFRKNLKFIESKNEQNPYDIFYKYKIDLGDPAFIKRYILHIFWDPLLYF